MVPSEDEMSQHSARPGHLGRIAATLAVAAGLLSAIGAQAPAHAATTGSISGTVIDSNKATIAGVCVAVYRELDLTGWPAPPSAPVWTATTDASGAYQVTNLPVTSPLTDPHNRFSVFFHDCGPISHYPIWWNQSEQPDNADAVSFSQGINPTGINATMNPAGSITGTITDAAGQPLEGVCVQAPTTGAGGDIAESDSTGTYTLAIRVSQPTTPLFETTNSGCSDKNYLSQYYGGSSDPAHGTSVSVDQAGRVLTGIDAHMQPGASITGTVTGTLGQPLAGVQISVSSSSTPFTASSAFSDSTGHYEVKRLTTASYKVGFGGYGVEPQWYDNKPDAASASPVAVVQAHVVSGIDAVLITVPAIASVSPAFGPTTGGTTVTVTGTNLTGATSVTFGGRPAASFQVLSDSRLTAVTPPAAPGIVALTVTNPAGTSQAASFEFHDPPAIAAVSPSRGSSSGGTTVVVQGTGFSQASDVRFGSQPAASFRVDSDSQITATSPTQAPGTVDVTVTGRFGTSAPVGADRFTFVPPPVITGLTPSTGLAIGGGIVVINGTRLATVKQIMFGDVAATNVAVVSDTQVVAVAPPHAPGTVDVIAVADDVPSDRTPSDRFTFVG